MLHSLHACANLPFALPFQLSKIEINNCISTIRSNGTRQIATVKKEFTAAILQGEALNHTQSDFNSYYILALIRPFIIFASYIILRQSPSCYQDISFNSKCKSMLKFLYANQLNYSVYGKMNLIANRFLSYLIWHFPKKHC